MRIKRAAKCIENDYLINFIIMNVNISNINQAELKEERALMKRLRDAIQFCKDENEIKFKSD